MKIKKTIKHRQFYPFVERSVVPELLDNSAVNQEPPGVSRQETPHTCSSETNHLWDVQFSRVAPIHIIGASKEREEMRCATYGNTRRTERETTLESHLGRCCFPEVWQSTEGHDEATPAQRAQQERVAPCSVIQSRPTSLSSHSSQDTRIEEPNAGRSSALLAPLGY